jgi:ABC-type multidrug transport system fused ATPase/permease subunit
VVLKEGKIEAVDTHGPLLEHCALYRRLYAGQFSE